MKKATQTIILRNITGMLLVLFFLLPGINGIAQPLLVEDFDYPIGDLLTDHGWAEHSGGTTGAIGVTDGLTFPGYAGSGVGGAAYLKMNGQDVNRTFAEQTSGVVYASFIVQTEATNSQSYFLHFGQSTISTTFFTRIYVSADGTGIGLGLGSTAPTTWSSVTPGTPALVVIKLDIDTKVSSFYLFNSFPASEPAVADLTVTETASFSNVGSIALRQFNNSQKVIVDGIRVATNWADAVAGSGGSNLPPSITNIIQTPASGITPSTTVSVSADITDSDGTIASAVLNWGTASGTLSNNINMTVSSGDTYTTASNIPAQTDGATVYYTITATDNDADAATSPEQNYVVSSPASKLAFVDFPAAGTNGQAISTFTVEAQKPDNSVDPGFIEDITLSIASGTGTLGGTLTQTPVAGVATFNNITFSDAGSYTLHADAAGLTQATSSSIAISAGPAITASMLPLYVSGSSPSNSRLPFAYRATLSNLLPNATYRYINQLVTATDAATSNGAGNPIYVATDGTFTSTSSTGFSNPGQYGEFITNASGEFTGWFMNVPTSNARFTPGNQIYARIALNNGADGTTAVTRVTSADYMTVLAFNSAATDGTAIRGISNATPKNFVFLYDNTAGTGRPLWASSIEVTGVDFSSTSYAGFYSSEVYNTSGSWGGIVPNTNANGVQRIEERALATGALIESENSANGMWGTTNTVNPTGGIADVLVIDLATPADPLLTVSPSELAGFFYTEGNGPSMAQTYTLSGVNLVGSGNIVLAAPANYEISVNGTTYSAARNVPFAAGTVTNQPVTISVRLRAGLTSGMFNNELISHTGGGAPAVNVTCSGMVQFVNFASIPYSEDFTTDLGLCTPYSVAGDTKEWEHNALFGTASMSGLVSGELEEDWLILPGITLAANSNIGLSFDSWKRYGIDNEDNYLKLLYSTDYIGFGDPGTYTWTELPFNAPAGELTWTSSGTVDLSAISSQAVFIAFKYHYDNGFYRSWQIDNIEIAEIAAPGNLTVMPGSLSGFTYAEGNGPSAEQSFMISGDNLTSGISIAASANYEISTGTGGSFVATNPLVLTQTGGNVASTTVYVRLKAGLAVGSYSGEQLIATSTDVANKVVTLNGSVTTPGSGGLLLVDNFEYTIGSNLVDNGWVAHSGAGTESPTVTNGLSFEGYAGTDIGGAALLDNNGEDVHRNFEEQTTGTVYAAFILNPTDNAAAGYFIHFGQTNIGTTFFTRVWLNASGDGLGVGQSAPATFAPITAGQPTLGVMKFDFATSTSSLYVFSSFPSAEPAVADAEFIETGSFTNIGSIALRQFNSSENIIVDGIRVATTWEDAVAASGGTPVVDAPTFNPPAGNYLNPVDVTISSSTADATLYYSETSVAGPWTAYTTPVNVASATTIWAYGEKDGYTDSPVVSASYTFNQATPVATIAELRQGSTDGTVYQLTGEAILTFKASTRNQKFIQDATAAIMIDDSPGIITTAYNLYDGLTGITGTLIMYQNMLEFIPTADPGDATSTGNTVTPVEIALSDLDNSYQAQLVKVLFVDFVADGNFAASTNYDITDPTGSGVFRTQYTGLDYIGTPIPTEIQDITGVIMQFSSTMQLVARNLDDFTNSSTTDPLITVNPTSLSGFTYLEGNGPSAEQSFMISGENLTTGISIAASANYEISTGTGGSFVAINPVVLNQTGGNVAATTIYVRLKAGLAAGSYSGEQLIATSATAANMVVTLNGSVTTSGSGGLLLVDNFEYTIGSNLVDNGWVAHSGAGTESPTVTNGLSFEGYAGTDIGGAALLDNNGEDVHRNFEEQTAGTVYAAFILNPTDNAASGYFIHFGQTTLGTTFFTRVWLNANGDGLGIGQSAPDTYAPITAGQPTLGVMKFDFATMTSSLFVFNSFPDAEPAVADAEFIETASFTNIGSIALRQFNAAENIVVDAIRVATTWEDAVAPSGGTPVVASPTFNPPAGNYQNPVDVAISSSTAGATVYYSESSATGPWTVYTTPINVASATTIWAYGEKEGYNSSPVINASYTFNQATPVATIAELRQGSTDGTVYQLTGEAILTFQTNTRNQKFIQDATAAIMIDDSPGIITTDYNLYDGLTGITGTLMLYQDMLEFIPTVDPGAATSTGNTVTPVEVVLSDIDNSYQSKLVKVLFVDFVADGNFTASTNYDITDPTGSGVFRTQYAGLDYIGTPIPTEIQDITGVIMQYSSTMQLVARNLDDFTNSSTTDPLLTVSPTSLSGFTYLEGNGPSAIQTYVLNGTNLEGAGNITVTAPANYEVSSDGTAFEETLSYPFTDGIITGQPITVSVRLKAGLAIGGYSAETIVNAGGGANEKVVTCNGSVTSTLEPGIASEIVPLWIQGINSNNQRLPFGFRLSLSNLNPNSTYRYWNQAVVETDSPTTNGAGNPIFVNVDGTFVRTTSTSMTTPGGYGEFITDASGSYSGWFILEATGNSRFTPGNSVFMRLMLNDGSAGTSIVTRLTTTTSAGVINFGTESDVLMGTGIRGISNATPKNFVFLYDNEAGTGRPLHGTSIETTGVDFAAAGSYVPFYGTEVQGSDGSWGGIVPNVNADGVRLIEERSLTTGEVVNTDTSADGVWGTTDTRNPLGGDANILVIDLTGSTPSPMLTVNPSTLNGFAYIEGNGPSAIQTYVLSGTNLEGTGNIIVTAPANYEVSSDGSAFGGSLSYAFANGTITGQPITVSVRLKAGLALGEYNAETIVNSGGGATEKVVTCNGSVTLQGEPGLAEVTLPMFIQGSEGSNNNRVPVAYRASFANLAPNAAYRFYNKAVVEGDAADYNGAGNCIFVDENGTFIRTTSTSLATPGEYGEFTTDASGSFTGWFITEPTGNARFSPGNEVFMRIMLNDGNEGTAVAHRLTTDDFATVLQFGTEADPTHGTAIRGFGDDSPKDFVYLYNNVEGNGRPLYGAHIESTEVDFAGITSYAPFYVNDVAGDNGSWGGIVPNANPAGVQRVEVRSLTGAGIVQTYMVPSGVWINTDTRNPNGGVEDVLVLDLITISVLNPGLKEVNIYSFGKEITIEAPGTAQYEFSLINLQGQSVITRKLSGSDRYVLPVNVPTGIYIVRIIGTTGISTAKVYVR